MLKTGLLIVLVIHGLIHLLGVVKEWHLAKVTGLSDRMFLSAPGLSSVFGALWLLACLLFTVPAAGLLLNKAWWWIPALAGAFLSQLLIVFYWPDAKAGTIANILVAAAIAWVLAGHPEIFIR